MGRIGLGSAAALLLAVGCGGSDADTLYINGLIQEKQGDDTWQQLGRGCFTPHHGRDEGMLQGLGFGLVATAFEEGGILHVTVEDDDGEILAERKYDEEFTRSGELDRIEVVTDTGREIELLYWGDTSCNSDPPED